jgi:acyl-homoserine-lactone acylase
MQVPQRAKDAYQALDPKTRSQSDGFAAGVNHFINQNQGQIPDWIEPIEPHDMLGFAMYIDTMFAMGHSRRDLEGSGVKLSARVPRADLGRQFGSNQFAVSPKRSASGACMLSMDPHLRLSGFFRWYEMHLVGPEINAMGACFFGSPYVSMGRTEGTAWCMTVNGPDLGDVFTFEVNPDDSTQYKGVDGWQKFETSLNTFKVKTENGIVERSFPAMRTEVGPVVTVKDGVAYVFALPISSDTSRASQLYNMMKAKTMDQFREATKPLGLVMFNILYADIHGDIFWISNGRVPKRDQRIASNKLRPGDQEWAYWKGIHPQEDLPQVVNPTAGYIVNTNSGPQNVTPEGSPDPKAYPAYMMSHKANSRLRRLNHLLGQDQSISYEEMKTYATDTTVEADEEFINQMIALAGQAEGDDAELFSEVAASLKKWDRRTDLESKGAVLFHYLLSDQELSQAIKDKQDPAIGPAVLKVAKQVQQVFGSIDVPWKEFSRIRRGDIEVGIAGSSGIRGKAGPALRPTNGKVEDGKRYCSGGSSYGMIVDFAGETQAISCLPFGVSENPESPYFANMLPLYAKRQFKPVWFTPKDVKANAASEQTLSTSATEK